MSRKAERRANKIAKLIERDGPNCFYCGVEFGLGKRSVTFDHVVPRSQGGTRRTANLRLACAKCNRVRGNQPAHVYEASRVARVRRRAVAAERAALMRPPAKWFHHAALVWLGELSWFCRECGSVGFHMSPASVPCAAQQICLGVLQESISV